MGDDLGLVILEAVEELVELGDGEFDGAQFGDLRKAGLGGEVAAGA
ncbi:hypothetical protein HCA61_16775 [Rhodococcus sp. HNM0563]|nr:MULTISPECIES: hypothetical protein [unclassified Rhodococcus (in: high G+C Gram-positive bacteria)]MCK0091201.1 hypothetical protein [Rhodococcus sp. F64268]NLU63910.1 hypothetical protein [Rhodococcus sp. HNM0563]